MGLEDKKTGIDPGEEDKTIVVYTKWKNPPKDPDETQKVLDWIQNETIKTFLTSVEKEYGVYHTMTNEEKEILYGKDVAEKPRGILYGASPVQQARESIQKANLIVSCICCKHWMIDDKESRLVGICQQTSKIISYDQICDQWKKIDYEDNIEHK